MPRIREIRKRDNRVVPFDQDKIADAIYRALRSVGGADRRLAEDLAACVTLFLEKHFSGTVPAIEDIQDMVQTVLRETGHAEVAEAYAEYRKKRATIREILTVHRTEGTGPAVDAGTGGKTFPWRKAKIVAALVKEADLEVPLAEEVAAAVEEKVLRSGLRRISTSLIRELVDNELLERGLAAKLKRQAPVAFPKYNLTQVIFSADREEAFSFTKDPHEISRVVAHHILKQYALEELCSSEVADAVRSRLLLPHQLGEPLGLYRASVASETAYDRAGGVAPAVVQVLRAVSGELAVPLPESSSSLSTLGLLSGALRPIAVHAGETPLPPPPAKTDPAAVLLYRVIVSPAEQLRTEQIDRIAAYYAQGLRVNCVIHRGAWPRAVPAKISVNLPQAAFRSARSPLGDFLGHIDHALSLAIKALLERRSFLLRASRAPELPLWNLAGGENALFSLQEAPCAVGLFGLTEAVKFLTGKEIFQDDEAFAFALETLRHLGEKTARESRGLGIPLVVEETLSVPACTEAASFDIERYPEAREIFRLRPVRPASPGTTSGVSFAYTPGVRLPACAALDPLTRNEYLAEMFRFVDLHGIVEDNPELRAAGREVFASFLEESWNSFCRAFHAEVSESAVLAPDSARAAGPGEEKQ